MKQKHLSTTIAVVAGLLVFAFSIWRVASTSTFVNAAGARTYTLVAAGDIACDPSAWTKRQRNTTQCGAALTSDLIAQLNPTIVLTLGDMQYENGTSSAFAASFDKVWGMFKSKLYPTTGNHEYNTADAAGYFGYFSQGRGGVSGKGYYSFNIGSWHIISLNSNCSSVGGCDSGSAQYTWLQNDLATHTNKCMLAFWHHPIRTSGQYRGNAGQTTDRAQSFWDLLYPAGVDVVLNGHDHIYERFKKMSSAGTVDTVDGTRQFTVGTGGRSHYSISMPALSESKFSDDEHFGVLQLTLKDTSYDWKFYPVGSTTYTDSGSDVCDQ